MKKKIIIIILTLLLLISIYLFFIRNTSKTEGLNNIKEINSIIKTDINNINGTMSTTHTTNMVHAANKEIKNEYDFSLENSDNDITFYLNDKKATISKENIFKLFDTKDISKCKTIKKNNKYIIKCQDYEISIYYSKLLHKYLKSIVKYNNYTYTYTKDNLIIKNNSIIYKYKILSKDNYKLEIITDNDNINIYYSNSDYKKYSISYKNNNFNIIIKKDSIIISIPCNVDKYINLEIIINNNNSNNNDINYNEISISDLLKTILNEQIYNMFN